MTSVVDVLITAALVYAVLCVILGILVARHIVASMESPPFRRNVPNGPLSLDPVTIHPTWGSAVHDPLQDYGIPFKHVEFPAANPAFSLRGWLVDNRVRAEFRVKELAFSFGFALVTCFVAGTALLSSPRPLRNMHLHV